jgi:hypothetical protein
MQRGYRHHDIVVTGMTTSQSPTPPHRGHWHLAPSFLAVTGIATSRSPASRSSPHPLFLMSPRVDRKGSRRRYPPSPRVSLSPPASPRSSLPPPAQTASPPPHPGRLLTRELTRATASPQQAQLRPPPPPAHPQPSRQLTRATAASPASPPPHPLQPRRLLTHATAAPLPRPRRRELTPPPRAHPTAASPVTPSPHPPRLCRRPRFYRERREDGRRWTAGAQRAHLGVAGAGCAALCRRFGPPPPPLFSSVVARRVCVR